MADAIAQGVVKFGQIAVDQGLEQLEFDMPMMNTIKSITGIPANERNDKLTPGHYVVLKKADITPDARREWIEKAADQNLTPNRLKASIKAGEVVSEAHAKQTNHGLYSPHGIRGEYEIWLRRAGGIEGIRKAGEDNVDMVIRELRPIYELVAELKKKK